jgi:hypothetical protein
MVPMISLHHPVLAAGFDDRLEDLYIAGATAQVPRETFPDICFGWIGVSIKKINSSDNHSRRTNPTLCTSKLYERPLNGVKSIAVSDTLNRLYRRALNLERWHEAAVNQRAVNQYGTRPALSFTTALFGSGQLQVLT